MTQAIPEHQTTFVKNDKSGSRVDETIQTEKRSLVWTISSKREITRQKRSGENAIPLALNHFSQK
jgi:hypothetical protein